MELWELEAREQIRELVARYNGLGDVGRIDPMLQLFAADAVLHVGFRSYRGEREIRSLFERAALSTRAREGGQLRHFTATHQIDLASPHSARGRCYYLVLTERGLDHWGRYIDEYRRDDGSWRIATRRVEVDGHAPGSWAAEHASKAE